MTRSFAFLAALASAVLLTAATPVRNWSRVVAPAPQGSYVLGNPRARVKLVEYISYTCPHCRHFAEQSDAVLRGQMLRSGSTSIEYRNQVHDKVDLAAAILARCTGPTRFLAFHDAVYASQQRWFERAAAWDQANAARMQAWPQGAQLKALAAGAGLSDLAKTAGMSDAAIDRCFADPAVVARVLQVSNATAVSSTPAFAVNGRVVERVGWTELEPQLRAAGAK